MAEIRSRLAFDFEPVPESIRVYGKTAQPPADHVAKPGAQPTPNESIEATLGRLEDNLDYSLVLVDTARERIEASRRAREVSEHNARRRAKVEDADRRFARSVSHALISLAFVAGCITGGLIW